MPWKRLVPAIRKLLSPFLLSLLLALLAAALRPAALPSGATGSRAQPPEGPASVELPILMYHDILKNPSRVQPYVISPAKLEQDLRYLQENGYHAVIPEDLVNFVENGVSLPEKPIMLTFDDGYFNNVFYAQPLLEKYGMRAVIFVVGNFCDRAVAEGVENPNYSYIQWNRLTRMSKEGAWDIQSHSWNMHEQNGRYMGVQRRPGQTPAQHRDALYADFSKMSRRLEETVGKRPLAFAFPYGAMDEAADEVLQELGYKVTVCSTSGRSTLVAGRPETLRRLCRLARVNNRSAHSLLSP